MAAMIDARPNQLFGASPEATGGGRRPRFEMRAEAQRATRGPAKLGLSTAQGAVEGIKMYAATHAAKEGACTNERQGSAAPLTTRVSAPVCHLLPQKTTGT